MPLIHSGPSLKRFAFLLTLVLSPVLVQAQQSAPTPTPLAPTPSEVVAPQSSPAPATPPSVAPPQEPTAAALPVVSPAPVVAAPPAPAATPTAAVEPATANEPPPASMQAPAASTLPAAEAPLSAADESAAVESTIEAHDLSPEGMFMAADWVVKSVMISLALASVLTWTVWLAKSLQLFGARSRAKRGLKAVANARKLGDALQALENRGGVVASMVRAAQHEVSLSDVAIDQAGGDGVKERVSSALSRIEVQAGRRMSNGTGVLASIGSTAPFVGLFGTVWGIMNSFIGIAETQTTNLAVVAPGIAEALLATAIGLVAAIPAVIIYNVFARSVTGYRQLLADAGAGIERLVSRDLDFRKSAWIAQATKAMAMAAE